LSRAKRYSRVTTIPFAGFYETYHDSELDQAFEQLFQTSSGGRRPEFEEKVFYHINWGDVHEKYAQAYAENLGAEFGIKLLFESLQSPREYNFTTDRIFVYIPLAEVQRLRRETPHEVFVKVCEENLKSRDGFASFYPYHPAQWPPMREWDHNHIAQLVQAYIRHRRGGEDMDQGAEIDLMESDRGNGALDDWVYSALDDEGKRLVKIADYLRAREERQFRLPRKVG
jgi:hypothetical protein